MPNNVITRVHTGNKGEWSEIYAFFKLLSDPVLYASDAHLNKIIDKYLDVQKIIREEKNRETNQKEKRIYDLTGGKENITISDANGVLIKTVNLTELRRGVQDIFESIKNGKGRSFSVPDADEFMEIFLCKEIKAASSEKADIRLIVHDRFSPGEIEAGFSIKSAFKAPPTLLNASKKNTSFLYKVIGRADEKSINSVTGSSAVRDRTNSIYDAGGSLKFLDIESPTFKRNLRRIDSQLPEIIAAMLVQYFKGVATNVSDIVQSLAENVSLDAFDLNIGDYEYKVKQFLEAVALGMTPGKVWNGRASAQGGYIIVKEDGELLCFHLYNREKFLDYLYENTKLESPSTTRHGYGHAENNGEENIFRLNLQVRFK